jgi:hypothetical protein
MLPTSPQDSPQTSFFNIMDQLDANDPLLALGDNLNWQVLENAFQSHCIDVHTVKRLQK